MVLNKFIKLNLTKKANSLAVFAVLFARLKSSASLRICFLSYSPIGKYARDNCCCVKYARKYVWSLIGSGDCFNKYFFDLSLKTTLHNARLQLFQRLDQSCHKIVRILLNCCKTYRDLESGHLWFHLSCKLPQTPSIQFEVTGFRAEFYFVHRLLLQILDPLPRDIHLEKKIHPEAKSSNKKQ